MASLTSKKTPYSRHRHTARRKVSVIQLALQCSEGCSCMAMAHRVQLADVSFRETEGPFFLRKLNMSFSKTDVIAFHEKRNQNVRVPHTAWTS